MPLIRRLSETVVNRIAAGEVIERPAAAAKELVENALDAGATRIAVSLDGGGVDRLIVEDDGCGLHPADLPLAVERHCTSKLADDALVRIDTLGFRGEALPSIGAAARLCITSRPPGAAHGHRIRVAGGRTGPVEPAACPPGTRVTVTDLFFATPARRKFLKSPRTEAEHAALAVTRLAFAAPHVAFRLEVEGRTLLDLPPQDPAARAAALLGDRESLLPVRAERDGMRLDGFAATPALTRATAAGQSLVVNGRPVTDPVLRTAVRVAYRDVIAAGRHPVVALWLHVPPDALDVNVHPAKTELRFQHADLVRSLLIGGVRAALGVGAGHARTAPSLARPHLQLVSSRPPASATGFAEPVLPLGAGPAARALPAAASSPNPALGAASDHPLGAPLAQVFDTYVIAVSAAGDLVLVDQHAAHERLTHEALLAQRAAGGVRRQPLLLPAIVDLPPASAARLLAAAADLAALGLELEAFGRGAVLVRALPAALGAPDPAPLLRDLADTLAEHGSAAPLEDRLDAALARLACHGSIRAGRRLGWAEMDALLRRMEQTPRAATCSHGRPTVLRFSRSEIEALFGRR